MTDIKEVVKDSLDNGKKAGLPLNQIIQKAIHNSVLHTYSSVTEEDLIQFGTIHEWFRNAHFVPYHRDVSFLINFANKVHLENVKLKKKNEQLQNELTFQKVKEMFSADRVPLAGNR